MTLVLIGAAALSGCGDAPTSRRASYATKDECLADWGDPKECEEQVRSGGSRTWGPSYGTWHSYSSGRSGSSIFGGSSGSSESHSVSRGGFGSHGSSSS